MRRASEKLCERLAKEGFIPAIDAAKLIAVDPTTIYRLVASGALLSKKVLSWTFVDFHSIKMLFPSCPVPPGVKLTGKV